MNTQRFKLSGILLAALMMGLFLSGCGRLNLNMQGDGMTIQGELEEEAINKILRDEHTHSDDEILDDVTRVDIQEDFVRVFGRVHDPEAGWQAGSYDLALSAQEGRLVAEIVAVDVPGVSLEDARIQKLNNRISKELAELAAADHGQVKFKDVVLTEDTVEFVIRVRWNEG